MKRFILHTFLLVTILSYHQSFAQNATGEMSKIRLAIQAGNSKILSEHFASVLEIKMESDEASYSKNQATFVLKDFFKNNPPKSFEYNHKGHSPGGAYYTIGTYDSLRGTFRVYIKLKSIDQTYFIDTLEFTKEK